MNDSTVVQVLVYPSCHHAGFAVSQAARLVSPCSLPLKRQAPHTVPHPQRVQQREMVFAACSRYTKPTTRARFPLVNTERMYGPIRCSRMRNRTALPLAVDERFELPNP